jgi:hypothetical protein
MALARRLLPLHDICNMEIGRWTTRDRREHSKLAGGDRAGSTGHSNVGSAAPLGNTLGLFAKSKTDQPHHSASASTRR